MSESKSGFATMQASEMSRGFASMLFSPVEVATALLERIGALNGELNAFYLIDADAALSQARASEKRWTQRAPLSALDGVPTSIKDALPSIGHQSFRGSAAHADRVPESDFDAPVVARMREAGMVFLGKTTMPDFGILPGSISSKHGITRNPWDTRYTAGGSSAGVASSISAGLNPVAVGTDIVGSIRLPASFCGIFGFKPSQGRVPYYFPNSPSLVAGPMARSVQDAALLLNIIARPDARDFSALPSNETDYDAGSTEEFKGKRLTVIEDLGFGVEVDPAVLSAFNRGVDVLRTHGLEIERRKTEFTSHQREIAELFYKVRCRAEFSNFSPEQQQRAQTIARWSASADSVTAVEYQKVFGQLQQLRERAHNLIAGGDFLLLPTVPKPPFCAELAGFSPEKLFEPWINTFLFNITEQPGSSVPCGHTPAGLPVGMQIVGRRFDDQGVMRLSRLFEQLSPWMPALNKVIQASGARP